MEKYVLGADGYALLITDKPLSGFYVYRILASEEAERLISNSARMKRIHFSQLDKLLK